MEVRLDLHVHSERSHDGRMSPKAIAARAKAAGLQGVAICDHDRFYAGDTLLDGVLIIPGVEFSTQYGHLLGLFVEKPFESGDVSQIIEKIHAQGGLAVLAHPFQHNSDGARLAPIVHLLDGVEVWNSRADRKNRRANAQAKAFAETHGLLYFAGSDAHVPQEVGGGCVVLHCDSLTLPAVKEALLQKAGQVCGQKAPARHAAASQWTKLKKKQASPAAYAKWLLFAGQCLLGDIREKRGERYVFDR